MMMIVTTTTTKMLQQQQQQQRMMMMMIRQRRRNLSFLTKSSSLSSSSFFSSSSYLQSSSSSTATSITFLQQPQQQNYHYPKRFYSSTTSKLLSNNNDNNNNNDEKKEKKINYQIINNNNNGKQYTDEEIEAIIEAEEKLMEEEQKEKYLPNWTPGKRKRPLQLSYTLDEFRYELEPEKHPIPRWTLLDKRCGLIGIKVGMLPVYEPVWGVRYPCTVVYIDNNIVLGHKTMEKHKYSAIQIAAGQKKIKNVGKCVLGQYKHILGYNAITSDNDDEENQEQHPPYMVKEFRISDEKYFIPIGQQLHAMHFVPGQNVDVTAITKGKGFQGGMKRHGFKGLGASHGVSLSHRAIGSVGSCQDPGKVFKGKKMPGHLGTTQVTIQNLRILKIDRNKNLIYIIGAIPGNKGNFVTIRDAVKKPLWDTNKVLNNLDRPPLPTYNYDSSIDGCNNNLSSEEYEIYMPMPLRDPLLPDQEEEAA